MTDDKTTSEGPPRRRKKPQTPEPRVFHLEPERENRERLTLFRPNEEIVLNAKTRFVILPAELGHGWVLKVFYDTPEE